MTMIRPFAALYPKAELAKEIAALPYDVYTRKEAVDEIKNHPLSFLRIDRPETNFDEDVFIYDDAVYEKAGELLEGMKSKGELRKDYKPCYYIYELTMGDHVQSGIAGCVSVDEYLNGNIKRHENTREEKEKDRTRHIDATAAHTGPVYLAHRTNNTINEIIAHTKKTEAPLYDISFRDGIRHRIFAIRNDRDIDNISFAYAHVDSMYIADGHHRCAAAVSVAKMRRQKNLMHGGNEEYNYFLAVLFDEKELSLLPYHRVVRDLNWLTTSKLLKAMEKSATLLRRDFYAIEPEKRGQFSMFLDDNWYLYQFNEDLFADDIVENLDVSLLQKYVLEPVFGIKDPRRDKRIDFVGGIRGLEGVEKRCEDGFKVGFAMYPTTMDDFLKVADEGLLMPPKSTWFEPKLRSGFLIHEIER